MPAVWPIAMLFLSGAAALVYQLLWIKQLSLVVGVEVYAVTIAVSAFFAGLAVGGFWLGLRADRLERPLRLYAALEVGVAVLGVAATWLLAHSAPAFARMENSAGALAWVLPFALVGLPAVLMGGTLPVLVRACMQAGRGMAQTGGRLYAANTAGAIAGALLAPFLLLPAFGVRGSALAAAAINLLVALLAIVLDHGARNADIVDQPKGERLPRHIRLALILYAVAGGIALGYEVVWSQVIVQFMSTRAFAFAVMLATYLGGLMIGSAIYSRYADRIRDPWGAFGVLIALAGTLALLQLAVLGTWLMDVQRVAASTTLGLTDSRLAAMSARFAVASACLVLAPTLALGAAFPAALRLCAQAGHEGRNVGSIVALNTLGGIAGTTLTGFALIPTFGLVRTLAMLGIAAGVVGWVAVYGGASLQKRARMATIGLVACSVAIAVVMSPQRMAELLSQARGGAVSYYEESRGGTVAVLQQGRQANSFHRLYIQGVSNSGDTLPSQRYMRLQALLPLLIHKDAPKSALVIGFGTGITAGALSQYPGLEHRVVAELLPAVVRAAGQFQGNYGAGTTDKGLDIRLRDGRRELLASNQTYDLITLEPPPPNASGVVNLYSRDFYQLAGSRLNTNGLVAQWWPLATQNNEDSQAMVRAFLDAYPYATLWTTELHEMMLIGSYQPITLDANEVARRFNQPSVARALGEVGVSNSAAVLATWVGDRAMLERYAGGADAVTDDHPSIEYGNWLRTDEFSRVLPEVLALRTDAPLQHATPELAADVTQENQRLMAFYDAGLAVYQGDQERWGRNLDRVMAEDGNNPYYRWMAGGGQ
ncbi:spermidine synthase [Dyella terrae]|uniref:Spermidine synthase n=3 Tax=Rhodanobacteraceae TaxID=1775411 RepID=A0A4R0YQB0_9GAMM|nr:spermidine synthase [Dyella terrae]TCI08751.1 spermidine synthase [Dyella soli]